MCLLIFKCDTPFIWCGVLIVEIEISRERYSLSHEQLHEPKSGAVFTQNGICEQLMKRSRCTLRNYIMHDVLVVMFMLTFALVLHF